MRSVTAIAETLLAGVLFEVVLLCGPTVAADLLFHRVVQDPQGVQSRAGAYEKLVRDTTNGRLELYVEKTPTVRIPRSELLLVVVEKGPLIRNVEDAEAYLAMRRAQPGPQRPDPTYWVTFFANPKAAAKIRDFANQNTGRFVDLRIDDRRLGTNRLVGQFGGGQEYGVATGDENLTRLKTVLEPVGDIVIWK